MKKKEIAIRNEKYLLRKSKFFALLGRRRIGKTYLVRNLFEGKFTFKLTGLTSLNLSKQLANYVMAMLEQNVKERYKVAVSLMEALKLKNRSLSGFLLIF